MPTPLLLLEDDPAIAHTVVYALEREGFKVDHVAWLRDAAQRLQAPSHGYAAAILDVGLPDGNGLDLCRELRQRSALPIVMLTARGEELDRVLGLELGADDYITKPFSPRELCARLRSLLRRAELSQAGSRREDSALAASRAVEWDAEAGRIRLGGEWLSLTRLEQGLMAALLRSPGRIWSREALLDTVWGQDADSTDRTVDTHIKTLRAKLRQVCGEAEVIVTHRGMGYSLDLDALA